jgi:peptide/nickel transport system substrate-binding protein
MTDPRPLTRRALLQRGAAAGAAASLPAILAACGDSSPGSGTGGGGGEVPRLTIALPQEGPLKGVDPIAYPPYPERWGFSHAFETLHQLQPSGSYEPMLATASRYPDPNTEIYELDPKATWWDGTPVTAADVAYQLNRARDPKSWGNPHFANVKSIAATGPSQVTVKTSGPDASGKYWRAFYTSWILQKKFLEANAGSLAKPDSLSMGSGPYRLTSFAANDSLTLTRNEAYWNGRVSGPKVITFKQIANPATLLLAMKSGSIDGAVKIPPSQLDEWKRIPDVKLISTPAVSTCCFWFNVEMAPFDDVHVRRAFSHCIDRAGLVAALLRGEGQPGVSFIPSTQWTGFLTPSEVEAFYAELPQQPFDIASARAELTQSRYPGGFKTTIKVAHDIDFIEDIALNTATNLAKIGITLNVEFVDVATYFNNEANPDGLPLQIWSPAGDFPYPLNNVIPSLLSKNARAGSYNTANYKSPELDDAVAQALAETEPSAALPHLKDVATILGNDVPVAPVFEFNSILAWRAKFTDPQWDSWSPYSPWLADVRLA